MNKKMIFFLGVLFIFSFSCSQRESSSEENPNRAEDREPKANTFTSEKIEGTEYIRNTEKIWGETQPIQLNFVQQLGQAESNDKNSIFYKPTDIDLDQEGNLYVLDSGNFRIQKFTPDGRYLTSFGGEGQGPGEFQFMEGIAIDNSGQMFITDRGTNAVKILSPEGEEVNVLHTEGRPEKIGLLQSGDMVFVKRNLKSTALILVIDKNGQMIRECGQEESYEEFDPYRLFNRVYFTVDRLDNIYIAYATRNKIEKYSPSQGKILSICRPLNYNISHEVTYEKKQFGPRNIEIPFVNYVSTSLAIDERDRIWVLSFNRQLNYEEMALSIVFRGGEGEFEGTQSLKTSEEAKIDAYVFHIFNSSGHYLGDIPLSHHGGVVRIHKDYLYILEPRHTMSVYIYKIVQ